MPRPERNRKQPSYFSNDFTYSESRNYTVAKPENRVILTRSQLTEKRDEKPKERYEL